MTTGYVWAAPADWGGEETVPLQDPTTRLSDDWKVSDAQPLTIRLRGAGIWDDEDGFLKGDNDLVIATKIQVGNTPPVDKVHFLQQEHPTGFAGNFFNDVVYATEDFQPDDGRRFTIWVRVFDEDGLSDEDAEAINGAISSAATAASVAFPAVAPYAAGATAFASGLVSLIDNLDEHDPIISRRVQLELSDPNKGIALLQPGYYVVFSRPTEPLHLNRRLRVVRDGHECRQNSYAILQVQREFAPAPELEITQRVAKLLGELNGKGQSGTAPLEFLTDTMTAYTSYRKVERYQELKAIDENDRTDAQKQRLSTLENELKADKTLGGLVGLGS